MDIERFSKVPCYGKELATLKRGFWATMAVLAGVAVIWYILL